MKTAVILLALVAMVASQGPQIVDTNPELVQIVDYNPEQGQWDPNSLHYGASDVDPAFGRPGVNPDTDPTFVVDPAFGRPGANPVNGAELIDKEPAFIYPPRPQYPKRYDNPAWRGGK